MVAEAVRLAGQPTADGGGAPGVVRLLLAEPGVPVATEQAAGWLQLLGYARHEVVGRLSSDFLTPASQAHARDVVGIKHFTMFGEVYSGDPRLLSFYTTVGKMPSVLDQLEIGGLVHRPAQLGQRQRQRACEGRA